MLCADLVSWKAVAHEMLGLERAVLLIGVPLLLFVETMQFVVLLSRSGSDFLSYPRHGVVLRILLGLERNAAKRVLR